MKTNVLLLVRNIVICCVHSHVASSLFIFNANELKRILTRLQNMLLFAFAKHAQNYEPTNNAVNAEEKNTSKNHAEEKT